MASATITQKFLDGPAATKLANAAAIDAWIKQQAGTASFISWFNAAMANKDAWKDPKGKKSFAIPDTPQTRARFATFWDAPVLLFGAGGPSAIQFLCLMSIFINEVGGDLVPIEEGVNKQTSNPPGIAYAFNAIPAIPKVSYNTGQNKTAHALFGDADYRAAHGHRALFDRFPDPTKIDPVWKGEVWPAGFPTKPEDAVCGFLLEADFYKFRGRGLIQSTWRPRYIELITFIQAYAGQDPIILKYKTQWAGQTPDKVATISSNEDWRTLFRETQLEIARKAIELHNKAAGKYLDLAKDSATLNSEQKKSVFSMGRTISGGQAYGRLFKSRVLQLCNGLGN